MVLERGESQSASRNGGEAADKRRRSHRGLGAPVKALRRLDRQVGGIFKTRYPTRYADWFYGTAIRWLIVPVVAGPALCIFTILAHLSRWIFFAGELLWITGMVALALAMIPAGVQQYWQMARAIGDTENRRRLVMAREDAAYRRLRVMEPDALRLCRQRSYDALVTLTTLPAFAMMAGTICISWFGPKDVGRFLAAHHGDVFYGSAALLALGVLGGMMYANLRRHLDLLTISLSEDPHDFRLPHLFSWLQSLRGRT